MIRNRKEYEEIELKEKAGELSNLRADDAVRKMENLLNLGGEIQGFAPRAMPVALDLLIRRKRRVTP